MQQEVSSIVDVMLHFYACIHCRLKAGLIASVPIFAHVFICEFSAFIACFITAPAGIRNLKG